MVEAAAAAATETRVHACGPHTIEMRKTDLHHSVLRVHGPVVIFHETRKIGHVRSKVDDDEEPPDLREFDQRMEVKDLSIFRSYTACRDLIHKMLARAPATGKLDLAADNWDDFRPHAIATTIVANVRRDTGDVCGVVPVPAYAIDIEMVLQVTLIYSEAKALLLACRGEAAGSLARDRKRRRRNTNGELCAICFSDVETQEEETVTLPCSHSFHSRCIGPWFHRASTCPTCRRDAMKYFGSVRSLSIGGS